MLGYFDFVEGLSRGFAAHHAGMLPLFREVVEELFTAARIRAVFATETLALGINMPARTVVLEKLVKFNGEAHVDITPAEYTQLTGRAGRRGIDVEGHAVVQWARGVDPLAVGGLASTRTYPLRSSFRPDVQHGGQPRRPGRARGGPRDPRDLVRAVPGRPGGRRHRDRGAPQRGGDGGLRRGDALPPRRLPRVRGAAPLARRRREGRASRRARPPVGPRPRSRWRRCGSATSSASRPVDAPGGPSSCSRPARARARPPGPGVVTEDKQFRRLTLVDVPEPVEAVAHVKVPPHFNPKSPRSRRDLATSLRIAVPHGSEDSPAAPGPRGHGRRSRSGSRELRARAQGAPVPPVPRPRDARPLGGAVVAPQARDRRASSARSRAAPTPSRAPSTGSARPSRPAATSPRTAPSSPSAASGCAGSTPRRTCSRPSACATTCGSASTPRGWPPRCRRSSTSRATRRPRSHRGCPTTTSPRR